MHATTYSLAVISLWKSRETCRGFRARIGARMLMVMFLASDDSRLITGQTLLIDG